MAADALFVGWGAVARGREQMALEVFQEAIAFWSGHQEAGRIDSFEPVLLRPHGGDLAGFLLIKGSQAALDEIQASPEFMKLTTRVSAVVDNNGAINAFVGDGVADLMGIFGEVSQGLPQH